MLSFLQYGQNFTLSWMFGMQLVIFVNTAVSVSSLARGLGVVGLNNQGITFFEVARKVLVP